MQASLPGLQPKIRRYWWNNASPAIHQRMAGIPQSNFWRWTVLPMAIAAVVVVVEIASDDRTGNASQSITAATLPAPGYGPADFPAALTEADRLIELGREKLRRSPQEWTSLEMLARGLMSRARLTGDYRAWAEAERRLQEAFAIAPAGSGPLVAATTLALSTHRLDAAEQGLAQLARSAVPHDANMQAGMAGVAGDIAFYRGSMAAAQGHYARGAALGPTNALEFRWAVLAMAQGDFANADAAIRRSVAGERRNTPQAMAEAAIRLGAHQLAQGNWDGAERWFVRADQLFPGHWLIEAHLVQARALRGDAAAADEMAALAARSNSAEVMDAAAMLFRHKGDGANSRKWAAKAAALWEERLALMPSAAYGHALEHQLVFGDPAKALDLARKNVAERPFGEARVLLAVALMTNNQPQAALNEIARAETSGWRSASLYAVKAEAAALSGRPDIAAAARARAQAINPKIFDYRTSLIWFSHG